MSTTPKSFYEIAQRYPDRPAVVDADGTEHRTYGDLLARVNAISNGLRREGLDAGDVVALLTHNSPAFWEMELATGQVGMYIVPINTHLTPEEIAYILRDSGSLTLVAHSDLAEQLTSIHVDLPESRYAIGSPVEGWRPYEDLCAGETDTPTDRRYGPVMGYTSGTTGRPRGVRRRVAGIGPERHAQGLVRSIRWGLGGPGGVHLVCSPLYHSAPGMFSTAALHDGHTIVCRRRFDPEVTLRDIEHFRVTNSHMVPTHFRRLLQLPTETRRTFDPRSLQALVHAGAPCPAETKRDILAWIGPIVWEYYGATDGGLVSIVGPDEWLTRPGTVGRPAPGVSVAIIDETGATQPPNTPGPVYLRGSFEFEYHGDPDKTAASRQGPWTTAGDIGYLDSDGYLFLLDRRDDLIISGGVNIYPREIEERLLTHPEVDDVAVIGVPDPDWGQSIVAFVQPSADVTDDDKLAGELLAHCRQGLAPYKHPRHFKFRSRLPRTEAGKLQRRLLRSDDAPQSEPALADNPKVHSEATPSAATGSKNVPPETSLNRLRRATQTIRT
ncbi:acyl-CoA synthetase [Rhodococcus sp. ACS1]|uniref:AMP-binding protein n=1 Tax=Rhodococcus sp. ACS1 TaxID=2028570 RepID=UPI000BB0FB44|nr:AMP-binding protein [Rhodococcus sp. ACS1]PBC52118.1 acyl-CoA synthetase [Rhodococcus sp. ACS1]